MEQYQSGTYCSEIRCERMRPLVPLKGKEYLTMKNLNCHDCTAWNFFTWLGEKEFTINKKADADAEGFRCPGFGKMDAAEFTEEELISIRGLFM